MRVLDAVGGDALGGKPHGGASVVDGGLLITGTPYRHAFRAVATRRTSVGRYEGRRETVWDRVYVNRVFGKTTNTRFSINAKFWVLRELSFLYPWFVTAAKQGFILLVCFPGL